MSLPRKFLLLASLLLTLCAGAHGASPARTVLPDSIRNLGAGQIRSIQPLRKEHLTKEIEFQIALKMRNFPKLLARMARGELIPQSEMQSLYLPLPADYQAVVNWANEAGLSITQLDPNRVSLFVKGTIAQVQTATQAQFAEVTVSEGAFTSAITAPSLPASIGTVVLGVNGLQPHIHPHHIQSVQPLVSNSPPYLVKEILGAYNGSNIGYNGAGETIAILIDAYPLNSDLTSFWSNNNISQSLGNIAHVQAVNKTPDQPSGEETLDTEWSSGVASGADIRIYCTSDLSFTDIDKGLNRIISDLPNQPSMHELSISLGLGETEVSSSQKTTDAQLFAEIANFGVTIFVSSGDDGAVTDGTLQPSYFSSDPSVTGVGGTTITLLNSGATHTETGWNDSGGGISSFFARPSWQVGTGVIAGSTRLDPDVAAPGDPNTGAYVFLEGGVKQIGGTSWGAPTWAGICALINQARAQAGLGPVGLLNPRIYPLLGSSSFRDITSGANGGYSAGVGYDMVTGIGTPNIANLVTALTTGGSATPQVTSFTPIAGPVGTPVTINGVSLDRTTGLQFNGVDAPFAIVSSVVISTTVPVGATTGPITLVDGTSSSQSSLDYSVVPLPTNDNFANATVITGTAGEVAGSNLAATTEPGEPPLGGASVWWTWQAPDNGTYTFTTQGSSFDTTEGIFTGSSVGNLSLTGSNDDYGTSVASSVTFTATAGTIYHVDVSGYQGASGTIDLTWAENSGAPVISNFTPQTGTPGTSVVITGANFLGATAVTFGGVTAGFEVDSDTQITVTVPPSAVTGPIAVTGVGNVITVSSANFVVVQEASNDDFANATVITGASGTITGNSSGATREPGEPLITGNPGGKSIWYSWTPSFSGPVTFTTFGSSFDTLLGVYTGQPVNDLTLVAQNDDFGHTVASSVTFPAVVGVTYHIAVDGFNGAGGNVVLNWSKDTSLPVITGFTPASGPVATSIDITGSNFTGATSVSLGNTSLAYTIISDTEITALIPQGATSGVISVGNLLGTVDSADSFTITAGPSNDDFANAIPLSGDPVQTTGANVGATREGFPPGAPGEPEIAGNAGGASVWWTWTAPATGVYAITTQGSSFDTLLGVYTGSAVNALTQIAANDDDPAGGVTSYVTLTATAGTQYDIAVDGLDGDSGSIDLSIFSQQASTGLYSTGFEIKDGFTAGQPLGGQPVGASTTWLTPSAEGNGILTNRDGLTGQQAYVGRNAPANIGDGVVYAYIPIDYTPVGSNEPIVTFTVQMAINDSSNREYDDFQWRLYNSKGHNFFTIDFANWDLEVYYLQENANNFVDTGVGFNNNQVMTLTVTMDYAHNKWSATLDGAPLVTGKTIRNDTSQTFDFGDMDAIWEIDDLSAPGNNYMLFDNYSLVAGQDPTPRISIQPQSQSVIDGNPLTLDVIASGEAPLFYQWMFNKKPLSGEESATLTIPDAGPINAGTYTVEVSNAIGSISSAAAKVVVNPQPLIPHFTQNPASATVAAGSTAVLGGTAVGYPAPTYQWLFNGMQIHAATKNKLSISRVSPANSGTYTLIASNSLGSGTSNPAVLVVGNSFASEKGTCEGMIFNGPGDIAGSGLLKITLGSGGSFTGSITLGGVTYRMSGAFNAEGVWQHIVGHLAGGIPITVNLQLPLDGSNEVIASILAGGTTETSTALRDNFSKTGPVAPQKPAYTMTLTGTSAGLPEGAGYASITVDTAGNVRVTGRTGDNQVYSFASVVTGSSAWPFYISLYKNTGFLGGMLNFEQSGPPDIDGTLYWSRPAIVGIGGFASGFTGYVSAAGYVYTPPAKDHAAIPLVSGQGTITFSGGTLVNPKSSQLSLGPTGLLVVSDASGTKIKLVPKTGVFSGTVNIGFTKPAAYYGVLIQSQDAGLGFYQSPTITGTAQITAP